MSETIVLDSRPLSQIIHPRKFDSISFWFNRVIRAGYRAVITGIVDYEVRRGLLRIPAYRQLEELDLIKENAYYEPITDEVMQSAARVWAEARRRGQPFTSDERLDGDAILIAQTRALGSLDDLTVITENVRHLTPFVPAMRWQAFEV